MGQAEPKSSIIKKVLLLSLVGGFVIWLLMLLLFLLQFIEFGPNLFLYAIPIGEWRYGFWGEIASLPLLMLCSMGLTFLYYMMFKTINSMWVGVLYGLVLFGLLYFFYFPIVEGGSLRFEREYSNYINMACVFLVYGLFIGYSISYEIFDSKKTSIRRI
ncbi:MAG: YqhR family membrane protein [Bacilli bacterium]